MSRIYFHSPTRDAELRGSERAWMGGLTSDLAEGMLGLRNPDRVDRLKKLIHPGHYMAAHPTTGDGMPWETAYRLALTAGGFDDRTPLVQYEGRRIDTFVLVLNTALTLGNDATKLAARLHGACEIHTWVDGPNRAWLADIMQGGLDARIYRSGFHQQLRSDSDERVWVDQGWGDVITLLRERDDEPVVTSYSVCDQFPNPGDAWQAFGENGHEWYDLEHDEQWRIAMEHLRARESGLEMKPDNWQPFRFDQGLSVLDLVAHDWEDRIRRALGLEPASIQGETP